MADGSLPRPPWTLTNNGQFPEPPLPTMERKPPIGSNDWILEQIWPQYRLGESDE